MKHIESISIHRYRGIKDLSLTNLRPVTLFLGENSIGKSTVLESLFMVTGPSNPLISLSVTSMRAHGTFTFNDINFLFYDGNLNDTPYFKATVNEANEQRTLSIVPNYVIDEAITGNGIEVLGNKNRILSGVNCEFHIQNDNTTYLGSSFFVRDKEGKLVPQPDKNYEETIESISLTAANQSKNLFNEYDELVRTGNKDVIIESLKMFDQRITNIESIKGGLFLKYDHLHNMVPLSMAGDGVQKFLNIAIHALKPSTDIMFIDEIENGLHFSAHQKLWECILTSARELGKQFFITTHNHETLKCLSSLCAKTEDTSSFIRVITLARKGDTIEPFYLSGDGLNGAMENDVEIRN